LSRTPLHRRRAVDVSSRTADQPPLKRQPQPQPPLRRPSLASDRTRDVA
jgi:hypothetical protein